MPDTKTVLVITAVCLVIFNLTAFILYGTDKRRARNGQWRISEKALFMIALPGSALGALLGMYVFRHKTRHWYFKFGIPAMLILQLAAGFLLCKYLL